MESYIKKINDNVRAKHDEEGAQKIKKRYLIAGGVTLGLGLAGFVSSFITFMVLFFEYETDRAMTAWFVAIPFIIMIVAGSVLTRIGDMLLRDEVIEQNEKEKNDFKHAMQDYKIDKKKLKADADDISAILGAILGDICGSKYEFNNIKTKDFTLFDDDCRFTDDTVMTLAVYKALKECSGDYENLSQKTIECMQKVGRKYEFCGYGSGFYNWLFRKDPQPYNSYGNGAAMRVSAVSKFANSIKEVRELSKKVTEITHNHEEGLKGAEATAVAIYLAKKGKSKREIKKYIEDNYYKLDSNYEDLVANYQYDVTCQGTVPQAIYCFLISKDFEDCVKTSISIGGDSDTLAAISCAIAGQFYGVPEELKEKAISFLDPQLKDILLK